MWDYDRGRKDELMCSAFLELRDFEMDVAEGKIIELDSALPPQPGGQLCIRVQVSASDQFRRKSRLSPSPGYRTARVGRTCKRPLLAFVIL